MKKIKYIIGIIILIIISCITIVYADYLYDSSNVEYNNSNSTLNSTSVQGAIDELYEKVNEMANSTDCPEGYNKTNLAGGYKCLMPICKRATTLHTETCSNTSSTSQYCRGSYTSGQTITYGQLGTVGQVPSAGDAFDCDVNGDGVYDSQTERFYYVSDYFDTSSKTFDNTYASLIYYSDVVNGVASPGSLVLWYSSRNTSYGPETVRDNMPSTSGTNAWRDDLMKTTIRNVLMGSNPTSVTGTAKSNFSYSGKAARLLTMQELLSACPSASESAKSMNNCQYFFENTIYASSSYSNQYVLWLESVYNSLSVWGLYMFNRNLTYWYCNAIGGSARPVIEVPKSQISY